MEIQRLEREKNAILRLIEVYRLKVDLHSQDSGIKQMLKTLIKQDFKVEDLKAQMSKKINEEKEIIQKME